MSAELPQPPVPAEVRPSCSIPACLRDGSPCRHLPAVESASRLVRGSPRPRRRPGARIMLCADRVSDDEAMPSPPWVDDDLAAAGQSAPCRPTQRGGTERAARCCRKPSAFAGVADVVAQADFTIRSPPHLRRHLRPGRGRIVDRRGDGLTTWTERRGRRRSALPERAGAERASAATCAACRDRGGARPLRAIISAGDDP